MRKNNLWFLLVTLWLVLSILVACIPIEATPTPISSTAMSMPQEIKLSGKDRGCTVELGVIGQRLSISLSGNPSTGYIWEPKEETMLRAEGIIRQVGVEFKPESDLLEPPPLYWTPG